MSEKLMFVRKSPPRARLMLVAKRGCTLVLDALEHLGVVRALPSGDRGGQLLRRGVLHQRAGRLQLRTVHCADLLAQRLLQHGLDDHVEECAEASSPSHTASRSSVPGTWNVRVP